MKKIRYPVFIIAFLLMSTLCACSGRSEMGTSGNRTYLQHMTEYSFNDLGVVYGRNFSIFFDPISGESAPLCTKLNCTHNSTDCDACRNTSNSCTAVIGEYQYFVDSPQIGIIDFCRADVDGRNRKSLHRVKDIGNYWYGSYENGYLIYCWRKNFDEHGQNLEKPISGICLLNLETEELERIEMPEAYDPYIDEATIDQGVLYYTYLYNVSGWDDLDYGDIAAGGADGQRRTELWKYDLASGEKSRIWERAVEETDRPMLGYGHIYINASYYGGKVSMEELATGKTVELDHEGIFSKRAILTDEGVVTSGGGEFSLWRYGSAKPETFGTYEDNYIFSLQAVTEHWVYTERFCDQVYEGLFYAARDDFLQGKADWKLIPGTAPEESKGGASEETEVFVSKFDDYPDDYFVKWVIWGGDSSVRVSAQTLDEINRKLEADGYGFGLKILYTKDTGDVADLAEYGADIVSTGLAYEGTHAARDMLEQKLFEPLEERLEGSRLYDAIPELCWESVRYQGRIYYVPNEYVGDMNCRLWLNPAWIPDGLPEQFDGDLSELGNYLSKEYPMYYGENDFGFAEMFGYAFDTKGGVLFGEDKIAVNPLDAAPVVDWLRTVNRWYHEGKLKTDFAAKDQCSLVFSMQASEESEGYQEYAFWKGYVYHNLDHSSGIFASSRRKDEAFSLLELFHTDYSYGNLLIYGKEDLEQKPEGGFMTRQMVYGLATGLKWGEADIMPYFATAEEKKQYYEEHFLPSPCLYTEFTDEGRELFQIERKYLKQLLICDDFDAMLEKFREDLKEPMDETLEKLKDM